MVPVLARAGGVCRGAAAVVLCSLVGVAAPWHVASANAPAIKPAEKAADKPAQTRELAGSKSRTRFVIMLDRKSDFQVSSLQNPNRVIVDLPDVKVQLPVIGGDQPVGLVKSFRGGLAGPGKMRVVIDVTEPVIVEKAHLDPGTDGRAPRLILEIVPVDGSKAAAKKPFANAALAGLGTVQPPLPKRAERPEATAARTYKPLIVLDPGHGGHDGGAVRNGAIEKEVVLLFSQRLHERGDRYRDRRAAQDRMRKGVESGGLDRVVADGATSHDRQTE